ncbi:MAG TPA: DMT family transporter [Terriglobia bacterium]|nr:DMT family transporter [Terriglobia bacterium]
MSVRAKAELLLVLICVVWGASFVVVKGALADASPLVFLAIRFTIAGIVSALVLRARPLELSRQALGAGATLGLFLLGGYILQVNGLLYTTPSKSAFITAFSVVLVPIILALGGAPLRLANIVAAAAGVAGLYVLLAPSRLSDVNRGDLLTLAGSISFGYYIVRVGRYAERFHFRDLVPVQILVVGLGAALLLPFDRHPRLHWTPGFAAAIAITALLSTALAFSVQNWAQRYTPPAHTALILSLEPVFTAVASRWITGERMGGRIVAGSAMMLAGVLVSELWGGRPAPIES